MGGGGERERETETETEREREGERDRDFLPKMFESQILGYQSCKVTPASFWAPASHALQMRSYMLAGYRSLLYTSIGGILVLCVCLISFLTLRIYR